MTLQAQAETARTRSSEAAEALRQEEGQIGDAVEIADRLNAAVKALSVELGDFGPADRELALATEKVADADTKLDNANALVDDSRRAASAAAAAHDCFPGEPCPVCGQTLPADWQPPNNPDLESPRGRLGCQVGARRNPDLMRHSRARRRIKARQVAGDRAVHDR